MSAPDVALDPNKSASPMASAARRYTLTVLLVIYTLNFLDRQIINILAEPIKQELGLADWQMGAMTGLAFAAIYTFLGIPMARFSDRWNRVWIVSAALATWSAFTVLCGLAQNFTQMLLARFGVGVGEAGCTPPAQSLITEITPKTERARALAFYSLGVPIGSLLGMVIGGVVADHWGWRTAFFIVGLPGILLALLTVLTVKDPRGKAMVAAAQAASPRQTFKEVLGVLGRKKSFWYLGSGAGLISLVGYAHQSFYGSFFLRNHKAEITELATGMGFSGPIGLIGLSLGLILGVSGALGTVLGGRLGDHFAAKGQGEAGYMTAPAIATILAMPILAFVFLTPTAVAALALLAVPTVLKGLWYGPVYASVQGLVADRSRATATAMLLLLINLIGLGTGPLIAGILSDLYALALGPAEGLRWAMVTICLFGVAAGGLFWLGRRHLVAETVS
ncbi:MFS transporter [Caulobacter sp. SLTY]|uniref:spinster family MFS transporter n=1 Tax=Caulobacter sp. SLTY TaxID=2683262 RepID=UPI0014136717|nr:MFS transporter [Caulobacter sp. SLTY]NBB15881.1 MFS transporter [Caulobacter sp. SLTY]